MKVDSNKQFYVKKKKRFGYNERAGRESLINILTNLKILHSTLTIKQFFLVKKLIIAQMFCIARNVAKENNCFQVLNMKIINNN